MLQAELLNANQRLQALKTMETVSECTDEEKGAAEVVKDFWTRFPQMFDDYSYGHLPVKSGYKWDYTFYKWGYKYL